MIWGAQLAGTLGVAVAIYFFFGASPPMLHLDPELMRFSFVAMLGAAVPALYYLRGYRALVGADSAAARSRGGTRLFVTAACVTLALRLSFRPFGAH